VKKTLLILSISFVLPVGITSAQNPSPEPVSEKVRTAATAMPDRILLGIKEDPATSMSVTWRTDTSVSKAVAELALAESGPLFVKRSQAFKAETVSHQADTGTVHYHSVTFSKLTPKTQYVYRVGDGVNWSAWIHFETASQTAEPFSFIYFGDAQNAVKSHWSRVFRQAFKDSPNAKFMLHAGDLVNRGNRDVEWDEWCAAGGWVNAMLPTVAIPGNHEYDIDRRVPIPEERAEQKKLPRILATRWQSRFEFPENGPDQFLENGLSETCYWFEYQGVCIVALNSMEDIDTQAQWLEEVLSNNDSQWTIVTHHHPVYSASEGRDNVELRDAWQPIYDKYKVDLVIQGHDHSYGRTGQRTYQNVPVGRQARSKSGGTVYVVSVSGPKMYERNVFDFLRRAEDTQLYQVITIDNDQLHYAAKTATGNLYDAFTLKKTDSEANELINQIPETPERKRPETQK